MRRRRERRIPRSRKEMRESVQSNPPPPTIPPPVVVLQPPPIPVASIMGTCLHTPYECSVYRYPPHWCSSCQIRAASLCAQNGYPDVRPLFRAPPPCPLSYAPPLYGASCPQNIVYSHTSCPTTAMARAPNVSQHYPTVCSLPSSLPPQPISCRPAAHVVDACDTCWVHERP
jgi:hypothetical protein